MNRVTRKDGDEKRENGNRLFLQAMKDVARLHRIPLKPESCAPLSSIRRLEVAEKFSPPPVRKPAGGLEPRLLNKLKNGDMAFEARLDLHGCRLDAAKDRLRNFVLKSLQRKHRCVLIITGKGAAGNGAIRREFRFWLADAELAGHILEIVPAAARHGGDGAFYVYLRKPAIL